MTTALTPRTSVFSADNPRRLAIVVDAPEIRLADGEFVIECDMGHGMVYRTIGRLTGRTRRLWRTAHPTIQRFAIDTVVIDDAIWGVRGAALTGSWAVHPNSVPNIQI
jgi:hypothetical protein